MRRPGVEPWPGDLKSSALTTTLPSVCLNDWHVMPRQDYPPRSTLLARRLAQTFRFGDICISLSHDITYRTGTDWCCGDATTTTAAAAAAGVTTRQLVAHVIQSHRHHVTANSSPSPWKPFLGVTERTWCRKVERPHAVEMRRVPICSTGLVNGRTYSIGRKRSSLSCAIRFAVTALSNAKWRTSSVLWRLILTTAKRWNNQISVK